jgi:hypothetical protein
MFVGKVRSIPKSGALGKAPALLENIGLDWKDLRVTNKLAYYGHSYLAAKAFNHLPLDLPASIRVCRKSTLFF